MTELRATPEGQLVPEWLVNLGALGWRILAVVALGLALGYLALIISMVTVTVLVSVIIAATFAPFVLRLRDRGWSRTRAAGVVTFGVLIIVSVTLGLIILAFVPYIPEVSAAIQSGIDTLRTQLTELNVPPEVANDIKLALEAIEAWIKNNLAALLAPLAMAATVGILSIFVTFFLLQDGDKAWVWGMQAASDWQRERVTTAGNDALERVGGFLRGLAVLAAVNAVRDLVLMVLLGVPLAGPLAVLVFILSFIPYFGSLVATLMIVLVAWASVGAQAAIIFLVVITAANLVEGNVMAPLIYGKTVKIHPAAALIALTAGAAVAGIIGLFVAIPIVALVSAVTGALIAVLDPEPSGERVGYVPPWLDRLAQWSWRLLIALALLGLVIAIAQAIPAVVLPVILAAILAATFYSLVDGMVRRGRGRGAASAIVTLSVVVIVGALAILSFVALIPTMSDIVSTAGNGAGTVDTNAGGAAGWLGEIVQTFGLGALVTIAELVAGMAGLFFVLLIATILVFYFLKDGSTMWGALTRRLPAGRRAKVDLAGSRAVKVLGGYMIATGAVSAFAAATQFLIMVVLGIPLALPLGVLSFFGGFIPYIGSLITTGAAFLVTVATGTPTDVAIMAVWTIGFNIVQGNIIAPLVYGRAVNLHPAIVLLSIPAGNAIAGIMGMFLAVPFIGVVAATWRIVLRVFELPPPKAADAPAAAAELEARSVEPILDIDTAPAS